MPSESPRTRDMLAAPFARQGCGGEVEPAAGRGRRAPGPLRTEDLRVQARPRRREPRLGEVLRHEQAFGVDLGRGDERDDLGIEHALERAQSLVPVQGIERDGGCRGGDDQQDGQRQEQA
jgi:hypothetical protein